MERDDRKTSFVKLRLAWVGPWNKQSSIAAFGVDVTQELVAQGHHVDVIRSEVGEAALIEARNTELTVYDSGVLSVYDLDRMYDIVIVNLGNHFDFHGEAISILSGITNGLAIFHDSWMGHFVDTWRYRAGDRVSRVDDWLAMAGDDASRLKALVSLVPAAVVHARHYYREVAIACAGPVRLLPLSQHMPFHPPRHRKDERLNVLTIGHANANKRMEEVIRGIGCHAELRTTVDYTVAGPIEPAERERLTRLARGAGILPPRFTGWIADEELFEIVEACDVICCLRYPSTEGGSGSLLTAMLASRPTIVSDNAVYAEMPDDVVMKCPPGAEAAAVGGHLVRLMNDRDSGPVLGRRAREYALSLNNVARYARELAAYAQSTLAFLSIYAAARNAGRELGLAGTRVDDPVVDRVAKRLGELRG